MGLLRTLLAITVVFSHSWPGPEIFVGGRNAVEIFYVISGFLISYVLTERNDYPSVYHFYRSRYLRLYPIYIVVAAISVAYCLITHRLSFLDTYLLAPIAAKALLLLSNLSLFGQDWVLFSGVHDGALAFTATYQSDIGPLYNGLAVPQAWSLGVELSFYLIAPFILRRKIYIFALFGASILLRAWLVHIGIGASDPWTYRFFPTELAYFLLGAISHQFLLPIYRKAAPSTLARAVRYATAGILLIVCLYAMIDVSAMVKSLALFGLCFLMMPLLFIFPRQYRFDNWIGDLSYPLYICHLLVIWIMADMFVWLGIGGSPRALSLVSVAVSLLAAIVLERFIGVPMEKVRKRLKTRKVRIDTTIANPAS